MMCDNGDRQNKVRNKCRRRAVILVIFAALIAIIMSIFSRIKDLKRGLTVNHAEIESVLVTEPPSDVAKAIEHWADNQSRWSIESRDEITGGIEIQLTRTTLVLRFIDDVQVRLLADGDWTLVDAASQSRVGKGDLGQNRRNLQELLNVFKNTTLARGGRGDDR